MTAGRKLAALRREYEAEGSDLLSRAQKLVAETGGPLVLAGLTLEARHTVLNRVASLAMRDTRDESAWAAWALLLMPPYTDDITTTLNVLSGVPSLASWGDRFAAPFLSRLLVRFIENAMDMPPIVAERAVDLLGVLPKMALCAMDAERLANVTNKAAAIVASVSDDGVRIELERCIQLARTGHQALPDPLPDPGPRTMALLRARLVVEAEGPDARRLANVAIEFVDAYLAGASVQARTPVLQRVRVASATRKRPLDDDRVWSAARAWGEFYRQVVQNVSNLEVRMRPAGAQLGSFVVDQFVGEEEPIESILRANASLKRVVADDTHQAPEAWRRLLDVLSSNDLTIEVRHYWGTTAVDPILLNRQTIRQRRAIIGPAPAGRVESVSVPQADKLETVFLVVDLVSRGEPVSPETLDVVPRQVSYYKRAAKILGLLAEDDTLAAAGRHFARLDANHRFKSTVVLFENCDIGEAWIAWSKGSTLLDVDPSQARQFLEARTDGLNGQTLDRRAQTLQAWWSSLRPFHYSSQG